MQGGLQEQQVTLPTLQPNPVSCMQWVPSSWQERIPAAQPEHGAVHCMALAGGVPCVPKRGMLGTWPGRAQLGSGRIASPVVVFLSVPC